MPDTNSVPALSQPISCPSVVPSLAWSFFSSSHIGQSKLLGERLQRRQLSHFLTHGALRPILVRHHEQPAAMRTGLRQRSFPGRKVTRRIIGAAIEHPPLARLALGNLAAI